MTGEDAVSALPDFNKRERAGSSAPPVDGADGAAPGPSRRERRGSFTGGPSGPSAESRSSSIRRSSVVANLFKAPSGRRGSIQQGGAGPSRNNSVSSTAPLPVRRGEAEAAPAAASAGPEGGPARRPRRGSVTGIDRGGTVNRRNAMAGENLSSGEEAKKGWRDVRQRFAGLRGLQRQVPQRASAAQPQRLRLASPQKHGMRGATKGND